MMMVLCSILTCARWKLPKPLLSGLAIFSWQRIAQFNRNAMVRAGHLEQISSLFTNEPLPPSIAEVARTHGINVVVCNK